MLRLLSRVFRRRRVITERQLDDLQRYNLLGDGAQADSAYSRLIGYIPSDAIALYLMGVGVFGGTIANVPGRTVSPQNAQSAHLNQLWWLFGIVCGLAPLLAFVGTLREAPTWSARVQWFQVISSPFAFTAWAFAIGGPFASLSIWEPQLGSLVLFFASIIITAVDKFIDYLSKLRRTSAPEQSP